MRRPQYLSPSSISTFYKNPEDYYLNYLADNKPPRAPQTLPMSAGSAFDAYVKNYLHEALFGKGADDGKFELVTLFEAQVEVQNRKQTWDLGKYLFDQYKKSGALADLMLELTQSIGKPRFEIELKGIVEGYKEGVTRDIKGVMLLGKPDLFYVNKNGCHCVIDWKVTGSFGGYLTQPSSGYVKIRDPNNKFGSSPKHRDAYLIDHKGIMINCATFLDNVNQDWAAQLSIYSWLLGLSVGEDFIVGIDQICCNGLPEVRALHPNKYPGVRIAEHRLRVRPEYQYEVFARAQYLWEVIHEEPFHYFKDLSLEESRAKCELLDHTSVMMTESLNNDKDKWLLQMSRT